VSIDNSVQIRKLPNACIALVGKIGSGKTTLATHLSKELGWKQLSLSKFLEHLARSQGKEVRRQNLQDLGLEMIKRHSVQFCREALSFVSWTAATGLVIDGLRDIILFEHFKALVSPMPALLVYIEIDENLRRLRLSLDRKTPVEKVLKFEEHPIEKGIEDLKHRADFVIQTRNSSSELASQLFARLLERLRSR
jgi:adenylate kinase family enzyme